MTEILLKELSSSDVDWMASVGKHIEVMPNEMVLQAGTVPDRLCLILEGTFALVLPEFRQSTNQEFVALSSGDVLGVFLLSDRPVPFGVKALEKSLLLAIDRQQLIDKLQQDDRFNARFYRAIAMLHADQHRRIAVGLLSNESMPQSSFIKSLFAKSIFSVFACLHDSDMCWMLSAGKVEKLPQGKVCIQEGKPLNALYVTLKGSLSIFISEHKRKPLSLAFGALRTHQHLEKEVSQILPGEFVGVSQFLDFGQNVYTIKAGEDSLVLSIPLPVLNNKLQQDTGFASRFYQALASLMLERTYQLLSLLRYGEVCYQRGDSLHEDEEYEDEMDVDALKQTSLGRARFNWMLKQIGVKS
jgi:CRP-like cAMP-binding protein